VLASVGGKEVRETGMKKKNLGVASILGVKVCKSLCWLGGITDLDNGNSEQYLRKKTIQKFLA
jgi:hypothetical protein